MKHHKEKCICWVCLEVVGEETWIEQIKLDHKVLRRYGLIGPSDIIKLKSHELKLWFWNKLKDII